LTERLPVVTDPSVTGDSLLDLYGLLKVYDQQEVAEVRARIRPACITARPEDAEERALAITLDVLRFRRRGLHEHEEERDQHPLRDEEAAEDHVHHGARDTA
jgi:hypothetical protein